jgi:nitrogen fixation protein
LGVPDDTVNKITLEALKIQSDETALAAVAIPKFEDKPLPDGSLRISEWIENIQKLPDDLRAQFDTVVEYIWSRKLDPMADFYWCPVSGFADRLIIPFRLEGRVVGHTARKVVEGKPKYISDQTPGYVFNLDSQTPDREFVIVVEGPMDALSIDAVAILGAEIMDKQALLINRLNRPVIVVPDRDADGQRTVEQALLNGYAVSMPDWPEGIKDVNDAAQKLGRLTALYLVIQAQEHNELKVRLRAKTWF